jgi:hypothetical protein
MRRVVVLALLLLVLPIAASASGIDIGNKGGTVTISNSGVFSHGSFLIQFNQHVAQKGHPFGYVGFGTGALSSGSIWTGGTFSDAGSYFNVVGKGGYPGVPKGAIFTGAFVGPINWTVVSATGKGCPTQPCIYVFTLAGNLQGQLWTGQSVTGSTTQTITVLYGQWTRDGKGDVNLGGSHFVTPEPGTLALLGTGLVGVATIVRRKLLS